MEKDGPDRGREGGKRSESTRDNQLDPGGKLCLFFFFSYLFCFLGPHPRQMEVPRLGVQSELFECQIRASSATYTTGHGNAGSLTH